MMGTRVLAVDDSITIREMLKHTLLAAGFEVDVAHDGEHGLEVLAEFCPDVIITDINMPKLDGFGFIERVRATGDWRSTPILVLTTESAPELKARARNAGATGWVVKPFDEAKLVSAVERVSVMSRGASGEASDEAAS